MEDLMEFSSVSSGGKEKTPDLIEDLLGPYESTPRRSEKSLDNDEDLIDLFSVSSEEDQKTPEPAPEHWIMMIVIPGDDYCTFYHSNHEWLAWPRYSRYTEPMKRFDHYKVLRRDRICSIRESDMKKFRQACWDIEPQHCQRYVIAVLKDLEKKGWFP
ncbi:hypothetical protein BJX68DRAFT_268317 [Aspergillus pseudodeflectus]|uniref:Uncharacterized protein n=1 Tax=Aspergillus pseudodeflectus TaxID=176178 RepID=A0ABR4K4L6_9EURO